MEGHSSVQCSGTDLRHSSSDTEKKTIEEKEFRTDLSKENNWRKIIQNKSSSLKCLKKLNAQSWNSEYFSAAAYIFTSCNQILKAANNVSLKTCCIQLTHFSSTAWRYFPRYNIWYYIEIRYYRIFKGIQNFTHFLSLCRPFKFAPRLDLGQL